VKWKWPDLVKGWRGALERYRYVALVLAVGVVLLLLPAAGEREETGSASQAAPASQFDLEVFEEKLADVLSRIEGAGAVRVVLSLDSSSRQILAQDQERDSGGGGSSTVVTVGRGSGNQEVVPLQTVSPQFRGALVVCPGGGEAKVRLELVGAVSALTGLGSDRIEVCQGNT